MWNISNVRILCVSLIMPWAVICQDSCAHTVSLLHDRRSLLSAISTPAIAIAPKAHSGADRVPIGVVDGPPASGQVSATAETLGVTTVTTVAHVEPLVAPRIVRKPLLRDGSLAYRYPHAAQLDQMKRQHIAFEQRRHQYVAAKEYSPEPLKINAYDRHEIISAAPDRGFTAVAAAPVVYGDISEERNLGVESYGNDTERAAKVQWLTMSLASGMLRAARSEELSQEDSQQRTEPELMTGRTMALRRYMHNKQQSMVSVDQATESSVPGVEHAGVPARNVGDLSSREQLSKINSIAHQQLVSNRLASMASWKDALYDRVRRAAQSAQPLLRHATDAAYALYARANSAVSAARSAFVQGMNTVLPTMRQQPSGMDDARGAVKAMLERTYAERNSLHAALRTGSAGFMQKAYDRVSSLFGSSTTRQAREATIRADLAKVQRKIDQLEAMLKR